MPPRRKPARPSILVAPGVSRARTSLPGPRARAFTALALLSTALLLLLHFAASRGSPLSSARSRGSPLSDSDSAKNKTESREGICEHLQSTAPHNATGNEALITEDDIKRRWKYKERMFVEGFSLVWCADDCPCCRCLDELLKWLTAEVWIWQMLIIMADRDSWSEILPAVWKRMCKWRGPTRQKGLREEFFSWSGG